MKRRISFGSLFALVLVAVLLVLAGLQPALAAVWTSCGTTGGTNI